MARGKKTGGRKRGTPNKATAEVKDKIAAVFSEYGQEQMLADFMDLKPLERLRLFASLAEYLTPKQTRASDEQKNEVPGVVLYLPDNSR
ncbi:hypothetical protein [Nafulsella turpanensis]|uniref:hypothetical protein n=1 Tax=Nafulsella turpanensis TaxID=1265690 RepID=UPI00034773A1|nr:hypothetical protein [Nafulsella turpanensis]